MEHQFAKVVSHPTLKIAASCAREVDDAAREDDRDNACSVDLQRNVGGLTAHHLTTLNALRVVPGMRRCARSTKMISGMHKDDRED